MRHAGKAFARLARQIEVAARDGGGDVEANPTLALDDPEGT